MSEAAKKLTLKENEVLRAIGYTTKEDYAAIKHSIENDGQLEPIVVAPDGTIVDGYTRYAVCKELKIEPKYEVNSELDTLQRQKEYAYRVNYIGRQSTQFIRVEKLLLSWTELSRLPTDREIEKITGIPKTSVGHIKKILNRKDLSEEILEGLRSGAKGYTIDKWYNYILKLEEVEEDINSIPETNRLKRQFSIELANDRWNKKNLQSLRDRIDLLVFHIPEVSFFEKEVLPKMELFQKWSVDNSFIEVDQKEEEDETCVWTCVVRYGKRDFMPNKEKEQSTHVGNRA